MANVPLARKQTETTYDRLSRWYDLLAGPGERRFLELGLAQLAAQEGETALEVGFGTGRGIVRLAQAVGPGGRVYGIERSREMLKITRSRVNQAGLAGRVDLELGDAMRLPFMGSCVDAVLMTFALELFDPREMSTVLRECWRVLRPTGRLAVVAMSSRGQATMMLRLYEWGHRTWPQILDCRPIDAQQAVLASGFATAQSMLSSMYGLPVEIILAQKAEQPHCDV